MSSSTCGFCGQDVSQFPEVATKNDKLATDIKSHEVAAEKLKVECEGMKKELRQAHRPAQRRRCGWKGLHRVRKRG